MTQIDSKHIFGPRVENYMKYRPGYPSELMDALAAECGMDSSWHIADLGSGTGLLSRLFLNFGCRVTGVEPNQEMRQAGDRILADCPRFHSLPGSAEETGLPDDSVDLITAGQAFHWFDTPKAKIEFMRILKPGGWAALIWNRTLMGPDPFMQEYVGLVLKYGPGWSESKRRDSTLDLAGFFDGEYRFASFPNRQKLTQDGLIGRVLSIAHIPQPDSPTHPAMLAQLKNIFDRYQDNGLVTLQYETEMYYGRLASY